MILSYITKIEPPNLCNSYTVKINFIYELTFFSKKAIFEAYFTQKGIYK